MDEIRKVEQRQVTNFCPLCEEYAKRIAELERDIKHALEEAKKYHPDFPWDGQPKTASIAVWALGQGGEGMVKGCEDRIKELEKEVEELKRRY